MKTKSMILAIFATAALSTGGAAYAELGWVDDRQATQRERIRDGVASGELTRKEARKLRKQQRRINRMEDRFGADGHYTWREKRRLDRALDKASKRIYRGKHNDRIRGSRRGHHHYKPGRRHHYGHRIKEIHHYYQPVETEVFNEVSPSYNRSLDVEMNGVRIVWSKSAQY